MTPNLISAAVSIRNPKIQSLIESSSTNPFIPERDIWAFLQDGFAKICADNFILSQVEHPWPGEGIIDLLVQLLSSGSSSARHLSSNLLAPISAVQHIKLLAFELKHDPTAFSDLDQLYTQILSVYPSTLF